MNLSRVSLSRELVETLRLSEQVHPYVVYRSYQVLTEGVCVSVCLMKDGELLAEAPTVTELVEELRQTPTLSHLVDTYTL